MKTLNTLTLILFFLIGIIATAQVSKEKQTVKFKQIDGNGDEVISKDEMIAFYKGKTDERGDRIHGIVLFAELDTNNDSKVTLEEFLVDSISKEEKPKVVVSTKKENPKKTNPKKTSPKKINPKKAQAKALTAKQKKKDKFRRIDADDNNVITLKEMVFFYKGKTNKKGEQVESEIMFYGLDKNKNNKITISEFLKKIDWQMGKQRFRLIKNGLD